MKYSVEKRDEYAIFTLQEENLNSVKAPDLKSELVLLKQSGIPNLVLNLEQVKYVDSSGLSAILTGHRLWEEDGGVFVLAGAVHPSVKMLINISRLDSVLNLAASVADAEKQVMLSALNNALNREPAADGEGDEEE